MRKLTSGNSTDYYRRLIEIANRKGIRTILDADGEGLALGIEAVPFALKPNIMSWKRCVIQHSRQRNKSLLQHKP